MMQLGDKTKAWRCREYVSSSTLNSLRLKIERLTLKVVRTVDIKLHQEQFYGTTLEEKKPWRSE